MTKVVIGSPDCRRRKHLIYPADNQLISGGNFGTMLSLKLKSEFQTIGAILTKWCEISTGSVLRADVCTILIDVA